MAELLMVGIAVSLSTIFLLAMADEETAGDFGSLVGTFEAPSEILSVSDLAQKCPGTAASVIVKNSGGIDANVRAIAINDATNSPNVDARYPRSADWMSITKGSTSDPLTNAQCNDGTYITIASAASGPTNEVIVSFTGTFFDPPPTDIINIELFLDSTFTQSGVNVSIQAYDHTLSNYATTSPGKLDYVFATPSSDYGVNNELPAASFLNNGQWQFRVTATSTSAFSMKIDLAQVHAIANRPLLREVAYLNNVVIQPGQAVSLDATLSRALDADTPYKVTIATERDSYSSVIKYRDDDVIRVGMDVLSEGSDDINTDSTGYDQYDDDDDDDDEDDND